MKFIAALFLAMSIILSASAHPPTDITATFELATRTLEVKIDHLVVDPQQHYIERVVIELNGNEIAEKNFALQNTAGFQEIKITFPKNGKKFLIKKGDIITIKAVCSLTGRLDKKIQVQ